MAVTYHCKILLFARQTSQDELDARLFMELVKSANEGNVREFDFGCVNKASFCHQQMLELSQVSIQIRIKVSSEVFL